MTGELFTGRKPYVVAEPDPQTDPHAELDAHWRAMPVQRLLDGGVLYGDVSRLRATTDEGVGWDETLEHLGEVRLDRGRDAAARGNDLTAIRAYRPPRRTSSSHRCRCPTATASVDSMTRLAPLSPRSRRSPDRDSAASR